jgi:hypothetical protein
MTPEEKGMRFQSVKENKKKLTEDELEVLEGIRM